MKSPTGLESFTFSRCHSSCIAVMRTMCRTAPSVRPGSRIDLHAWRRGSRTWRVPALLLACHWRSGKRRWWQICRKECRDSRGSASSQPTASLRRRSDFRGSGSASGRCRATSGWFQSGSFGGQAPMVMCLAGRARSGISSGRRQRGQGTLMKSTSTAVQNMPRTAVPPLRRVAAAPNFATGLRMMRRSHARALQTQAISASHEPGPIQCGLSALEMASPAPLEVPSLSVASRPVPPLVSSRYSL